MTLQTLSALWNRIAPGLADHLWQSTVLVSAVALFALLMRHNSARVRYSLWLAASLKFLVPLSVLVALGAQFSWRHAPANASAGMYIVEIVGQPFTKSLPATPPAAAAQAANPNTLTHLIPVLFGVWLCGFLVVLSVWMLRWWRIAAAVRNAEPLTEGREFSSLRRVESLADLRRPLRLLLSRASLEPGVFGVVRPVLLWPRSVSEHLDDPHLEAVMAHELCHVRRRDNLAAVLHMLVEAVFWFHPLVWWIGARLIEERERACDEAVLDLGSHRHIYAESILKVCEFCLTSPLTCVSGVTGADLKKRMVHIMSDRVVRKLNPARKLLLWTAAFLAIALPIAFGLLNATPGRAADQLGSAPKFATVSIKPHPADDHSGMTRTIFKLKDGSFTAGNVSPHDLFQIAYHIQDTQLVGQPDWFNSAKYDIEAKMDAATAADFDKLPEDQRGLIGQRMIQQLLSDYFKVTLHQASLDLPVYELVLAEGGSKLQKAGQHGFMHFDVGELSSKGTPLELLTAQLSQRLGRTVVDKTGLQGDYAYSLRWTPDADEMARIRAAGMPPRATKAEESAPPASAPPLATALEQQLGLKLQSLTTRVPVLVIDHAEQPAQN